MEIRQSIRFLTTAGLLLFFLACFAGDIRTVNASGEDLAEKELKGERFVFAARFQPLDTITFRPWELVLAVAWSPAGDRLAVAAGNWVYLYDSADLERQAGYETGAFTHRLDFSPDGRLLAAASKDGLVRVWNLRNGISGTPELEIEAHKKGANSVAFSPDGSMIASGGNDAVARLWDSETGENRGQIIGGTFSVPNIAFRPSGDSLAVLNGDVLRLREVESGRMLASLRAEAPFYTVAFSPDGSLLALGDVDNSIRLWEVSAALQPPVQEAPEPRIFAGHSGSPGRPDALIWSLSFSPDGAWLASAGGDGTVRIWDVAQGEILATLEGHTGAVTSVAFHPQGQLLASSSLDATLRLWHVQP